jgi:biotin carboxylase
VIETAAAHPDRFSGVDPELSGKRLLILGGGLWQLEYVRRARQLGLETWVTDWSSAAVAGKEADHFEAIDLKDCAATLALACRARIDAVFTAADIGVPTAAYVAEQLGLPGHSPQLAEYATNKFLMRQRSEAISIASPWYHRVRSVEGAAAAADRALPSIVKPVDNCSSRGVRWIDRKPDLAAAVSDALAASRSGAALIEEFLVGTEGSIEALVQDGRAIVLGMCDKTKSALPDRYDLELRYPGAWGPGVWSELESLAQRIAGGFEVLNGILHIEFLVSHDSNAVYLIEFAVRGCGSKVTTHLMPALTGVDVVRVLLRQALGLRSRIEPVRTGHGVLHFLMFPRGRVVDVRGVEAATQLPGVIDAAVERAPGELIDDVHDGRHRPGHVLVRGDDRAAAQRTLAAVRSLIRIDYEHAADVAPLDLVNAVGSTR